VEGLKVPNVNASFAGQTLIIPGAYYQDVISGAINNTPPTTPPLIFLGFGYGQKPQTAETYTNPNDLLAAIRGGPCSGFVPFLTNPSPTLKGAQQITYINVAEATQSSLTLDSGSSGVITLTSTDYGLPSNLLQAEVAAGTAGGKLVTLYDGYSKATYSGDNLGIPFELAYIGAASGVTYTVTTSGGVATTLSINSSVSGQSVSLPLNSANYGTIASVVEYLNGTGFYSAVVLSNGNLPSSNLDAASGIALPIPAAGVNQYVNVTATLGDIVYWVNQYAQTLATAALVSGITSSPSLAPNNIPLTLFSGGSSTTPTLSDYASGFNVALTVPGWAVFADNNASGIIALGVQHVETASSAANGQWRRFFSGSSVGDTVADATTQAQAMASYEASYVYPGFYANDAITNVNTVYSGLYAAAAAAGMATGNAVATPLTNKPLNGTGVEVNLTKSQINQLQQAGVMPIWVPSQSTQPTIVSDLTTWQTDNNPENVFNQQVACRFYLAYSVVNAMQPYAGTIADTLTETNILKAVKATLNALLYNSGGANSVLNSWNPSTLKLDYNGSNQLAEVSVSVVFIGQNRFVTATVNVLPLSITLSAT
jgi:hypothetical protein